MAKRIVVKCQSQSIPGSPVRRDITMANLMCKHEWNRDFDSKQDYFTSLGQYDADHSKCYFLLDNGMEDGQLPELTLYKWDGNKL